MLFKLLLYAENAMFGSRGLARAQKDATIRGSMEDMEPGDNGIPHQMNADEVLALIAEAADEPPAPIAQQEQPAAKKQTCVLCAKPFSTCKRTMSKWAVEAAISSNVLPVTMRE